MSINPDALKVDLDTPQPGGRSGESPRSAFTKYNSFIDLIKSWVNDVVTQTIAEAGTDTEPYSWSALRVRQAIVKWWSGIKNSPINFGSSIDPVVNAFGGRAGVQVNSNSGNGGISAIQFRTGSSENTIREGTVTVGRSVNDTVGAHGALANNNIMGRLRFVGSNGNAFAEGADVSAFAAGAWTPASNPASIVVRSVEPGSTAKFDAFFIRADGSASLSSGYGNAVFSMTGDRHARLNSIMTQGVRLGVSFPAISSDMHAFSTQGVNCLSSGTAYETSSFSHYYADNLAKGTNQTVAAQNGFLVPSTFTSGTNNYAFRSFLGNDAGRFSIHTAAAPAVFGGDVRCNLLIENKTVASNSSSATTTVAALKGGIITSMPTANITTTLPLGTDIEASYVNSIAVNHSIEFTVINLAAATHSVTIAGNAGVTTVGNMTINANSSASFKLRKSATDIFICYRAS